MGDALYEHILPLRTAQHGIDTANDITSVEISLHDAMRATKSIKNVYHNIQDLKESKDETVQELYRTLLTHSVHVSSHIASIIDREYSAEHFQELTEAQENLQNFHTKFIEQLTHIDSTKLA